MSPWVRRAIANILPAQAFAGNRQPREIEPEPRRQGVDPYSVEAVHANHLRLGYRSGNCFLCYPDPLTLEAAL